MFTYSLRPESREENLESMKDLSSGVTPTSLRGSVGTGRSDPWPSRSVGRMVALEGLPLDPCVTSVVEAATGVPAASRRRARGDRVLAKEWKPVKIGARLDCARNEDVDGRGCPLISKPANSE